MPLLHEDDAPAVCAAAEMARRCLHWAVSWSATRFGFRYESAWAPARSSPQVRPQATRSQPVRQWNVAKRLEELAGEGEILIDEETHGTGAGLRAN